MDRTQESVAISADGVDWFLLNVSPEVRQQVESFQPLHPRVTRDSPITGLLLTNGDLDHVLGLLSLRESHPLVVHATEAVRRGFTEGNVLYRTLERFPGQVTWRSLIVGERSPLLLADGRASGLGVTAVPTPGKLPVHLERGGVASAEQSVGLVIDDASGRKLAYFSSFASISDAMLRAMEEADVVFLDGTFWSSEELVALGAGPKRAEDMAHAPLSGEKGTLRRLAHLRARRVLIHINNTNPILMPDSAEAVEVARQGFTVAHDGLEMTL